jgi:hypothetical protein
MEYNTYLSDEEEENENDEIFELDQYGMPIIEEEEDEEELELRRIINNKLLLKNNLNDDIFMYNNESLKIQLPKEIKTPKKKVMNLNELNKFIDNDLESKKPKKFISKRSMDKMKANPTLLIKKEVIETKRKFNPRLIPYLFSDEYKNRITSNDSSLLDFDDLQFPNL